MPSRAALLVVTGPLLAVLWAIPAIAAGENARLRYELDDPGGKCVNEAAFRARVVSRLGYDPFHDDAVLDLRVRIMARGPTIRAEITSAQPGKASGKRTLEDPHCDALVETLASTVALVLDPVASSAVPPAAPPPEPPPTVDVRPLAAPLPSPRDSAALPPPAREPPTATLVPLMYADFTTTFARTPTVLVGGRLGAGLRRGSLSVSVEGHAQASPESARVSPTDRVDASALSGALVPCGHIGLGHLCGVAAVGARAVRALDVTRPVAESAVFVVAGARGGLEVPLSGAIALRADGDVGVPLLRTTYTIDGIARATTGIVEASLGIGLLGRFR